MAEKRENSYRTYVIPKNFIDSGRCFHGLFKTRGLVEGCILGGVAGFIAFLLPIQEIETKFSVVICTLLPFFALGVVGINGDPVSVFLKFAFGWFKNRGVILYNGNARFLDESPLDKMMQQKDVRDKIFDIVEARNRAKRENKAGGKFIEGIDFQFEGKEDDMAVVVAPEFCDDEEVHILYQETATIPNDCLAYGENPNSPIVSIKTDNALSLETGAMDNILGVDPEMIPDEISVPSHPQEKIVQMKLRIDLGKIEKGDLF